MPASRAKPIPKLKEPDYSEVEPVGTRQKFAGPIIGADGKLREKSQLAEEQEAAKQAEDASPASGERTPEDASGRPDSKNNDKGSKGN